MLLVTHSTCPEHGELVHPSEHSSTSGAHVHGDIARGATVRGDGSSSESHEDDHCSVLGDGRQRALSVATSLPAACVAAPAVAVSLPRSSTHVSSIALYMIAPKSSPPA